MIDILEQNYCTGCSACQGICPVNAIDMLKNEEGFLFPKINMSKCVHCNACEHTCPVLHPKTKENFQTVGYAAYDKDIKSRLKSSSGGIFGCLALNVLQSGGVICAASFDSDYNVKHILVDNPKMLDALRGSKYVQSDLGDVFIQIKQLMTSRKVLFVGTPCQVAGLKAYLGDKFENENLFTIDLICLGIPSPKIWRLYLDNFFDRQKITSINFKDKTHGWDNFSVRIEDSDGNHIMIGKENLYMQGFFKGLYNRKCCASCQFKVPNKLSDITLADCWGYQNFAKELYDNKGLSSVLVNSSKGSRLFDAIKERLYFKEIEVSNIFKYNSNIINSVPLSTERDAFWNDIQTNDFKKILKKYCKISWKLKCSMFFEKVKKIRRHL